MECIARIKVVVSTSPLLLRLRQWRHEHGMRALTEKTLAMLKSATTRWRWALGKERRSLEIKIQTMRRRARTHADVAHFGGGADADAAPSLRLRVERTIASHRPSPASVRPRPEWGVQKRGRSEAREKTSDSKNSSQPARTHDGPSLFPLSFVRAFRPLSNQ